MSSEPSRAVFLSYASQDAEAARKICAALRGVGVEVWFDQNELVGGDAWDTKIRRQIKDCALFLPVISANTQARREGYFRLEWKIADDRTHLMAHGTPFLVPVCVDGTRDSEALAPESFFQVQWTRLPGGETPEAFCRRVQELLAGPALPGGSRAPIPMVAPAAAPAPAPKKSLALIYAVAVGIAIVVSALTPFFLMKRQGTVGAARTSTPPAVKTAAEKSIAVLPFENLSADPENAFFTDGMHDEVITALGKVQSLRVIGRTSVLAYADPRTRRLPEIARTLNVTSILEGTVRRQGTRVHINVRLVDPATSSQIWAESYDEELTDAFAIQAAIATKVAGRLDPDAKALLARKPTDNPRALESYLKGRLAKASLSNNSPTAEWEVAIRHFEDAVAADPKYLQPFATMAVLHAQMFNYTRVDPTPRRADLARTALAAAVRLDPAAPETIFARGAVAAYVERDFRQALALAQPLLARLPSDDFLVNSVGLWQRGTSGPVAAVETLARAHAMNPQDLNSFVNYTETLMMLRHFDAVTALALPTQDVTDRGTEGVRRSRDIARYEQTGDRAALVAARRQSPRQGRDVTGRLAQYETEWWAGNWSAARAVLADDRLAPDLLVDGLNTNTRETVALHRALMAWLAGDRVASRREALQANAIVGAGQWSERQQMYADAALLLGVTLAGDQADALRRAAALRQLAAQRGDFDRSHLLNDVGRAYALLGEKDDAFAILRELLTGPGPATCTPRAVRLDPCWSQLAADPRFDQIIVAAKRL